AWPPRLTATRPATRRRVRSWAWARWRWSAPRQAAKRSCSPRRPGPTRSSTIDEYGACAALRNQGWEATRRSLRRAAGFVAGANEHPAQESETPENDETQERRQRDRGEQLLRLEPRAIVVDQASDTRVALAKEEVADDRADDRQARGNPPARQNGRQCAGQL